MNDIKISVDAVECKFRGYDVKAVRISAPKGVTLDSIEDDLRANWRDQVCALVIEAMADGLVSREQWQVTYH